MARYIDAEMLKKKSYPFPCAIGVEHAVSLRQIDETPTANVKEIARGEWINMGGCRCDCSVCGGMVLGRADRTGWADSAFCGHCGADMRGANNE